MAPLTSLQASKPAGSPSAGSAAPAKPKSLSSNLMNLKFMNRATSISAASPVQTKTSKKGTYDTAASAESSKIALVTGSSSSGGDRYNQNSEKWSLPGSSSGSNGEQWSVPSFEASSSSGTQYVHEPSFMNFLHGAGFDDDDDDDSPVASTSSGRRSFGYGYQVAKEKEKSAVLPPVSKEDEEEAQELQDAMNEVEEAETKPVAGRSSYMAQSQSSKQPASVSKGKQRDLSPSRLFPPSQFVKPAGFDDIAQSSTAPAPEKKTKPMSSQLQILENGARSKNPPQQQQQVYKRKSDVESGIVDLSAGAGEREKKKRKKKKSLSASLGGGDA